MPKTQWGVALTMAAFVSACGGGGGAGRQSLPPPANQYYSSLSAIWAFSDRDVWAVGSRVLHFDGTAWSEVAGPGNNIALGALWGLAPDDLWATAGTQIYRWRGAAAGWAEHKHAIPNPPDFNAIWVRSPEDYAVGGGAVNWEIIRVKGGTISRAYTHDATTGIWGASSDDAWAVAESGGFWHWTGAKWSKVTPGGGGDRPRSVWGFAASDVWAVGEQDTLQHWDGTTWTPTTIHADLGAVWGAASDDVWAAGDEGVVLHFDGKAWSESGTSEAVSFTSMSGSGPSSVWALGYELSVAGNHGVIFRLK